MSVTATATSMYLDGEPAPLGDATWVMPYRAHAGGQGMGYESQWNRALIENMRFRIPVGVFIPHGREYRNLGLAMVESYEPGSGTFLLRGPVRDEQPESTWELIPQGQEQFVGEEDSWVDARMKRRRDQAGFRDRLLAAYSGVCAATGYDAPDALQGAHILAYSGRSSQSVDNGLLLRADIHLLFDRHLLSVDPSDFRVRLAGSLMETAYADLHMQRIALPERAADRPSPEKLAVHWAVFARGAA